MSTFGDDLVQSLREALAHVKGDGPAIVHPAVPPREVREAINLTQAQMAPLVDMSLSLLEVGAGPRRVSGPAPHCFRQIRREPHATPFPRPCRKSPQGEVNRQHPTCPS